MKRAVYFVVLLVLGLVLIGFQFAKSRAVYGGGGSDPDDLVNCSNCGARIPAESETCDHCGEPITDTGRAGKDG